MVTFGGDFSRAGVWFFEDHDDHTAMTTARNDKGQRKRAICQIASPMLCLSLHQQRLSYLGFEAPAEKPETEAKVAKLSIRYSLTTS